MSYYWFNKPELLQKDKYHNCRGKENAAKYYIANKEVFLKKKKKVRSLSKEKKNKKQKENMEEIGIKT